MFYDEARPEPAPLPKDHPCHLGRIVILEGTVRFYVISKDSYVTVIMPYQDGTWEIQFTVPSELYNCLGFSRRNEAYTVTIWDKKTKCIIKIPALTNV